MKDQQPYFLKRLRAAGTHGVHTWDFRREGIGNPSQRRNELLAKGYDISDISEPRDGCPGKRYFLISEPFLGGLTAAERPHGACPTSTAETSTGLRGHAEPARSSSKPSLAAIAPSGPVDSLFDVADFCRGDYQDAA